MVQSAIQLLQEVWEVGENEVVALAKVHDIHKLLEEETRGYEEQENAVGEMVVAEVAAKELYEQYC